MKTLTVDRSRFTLRIPSAARKIERVRALSRSLRIPAAQILVQSKNVVKAVDGRGAAEPLDVDAEASPPDGGAQPAELSSSPRASSPARRQRREHESSERPSVDWRGDDLLMLAAQRGDVEAFGVLVRRYQQRIHRVSLHMLRDAAEAEDVTQDTFVRAYRALACFDGRSQAFTWLCRIAINLSLNALRARKNRRASPEEPEAALDASKLASDEPDREASERQLARILYEGMDRLSETLRATLVLVTIDGLSHAEAGDILGCPEGTVAWRVFEARRKLREFLSERGY
jgi:RNA polymerase sigma-70 factor, ECF subfamily